MGIYALTYCATDQEADSNPLWHADLLLSRYNKDLQKLEVEATISFGGVPATTENPVFRYLKINLGLNTDFYGNHGIFYDEERRFLERGKGLHGVTFEISKEKYMRLKQNGEEIIEQQNQAIAEAVKELNLQPQSQFRNYPYEYASAKIYQHEIAKAEKLNRNPRLHEFSLLIWANPLNCKARALALLNDILSPQQIERLKGLHSAIPRWSGPMETIFLHSTGPLHRHQKRNGNIAHYRKANDCQLFWTLPPQEIEALSERTKKLFKINDDHCAEVKAIIRKLQTLEWFFINASITDAYSLYCEQVTSQIVSLYESFAKLGGHPVTYNSQNWNSFFKWLATAPRDENEKALLQNIKQAHAFFNHLYLSIVDPSPYVLPPSHEFGEAENVDIVTAQLSVEQQKELCQILGRNYVESEEMLNRNVSVFK